MKKLLLPCLLMFAACPDQVKPGADTPKLKEGLPESDAGLKAVTIPAGQADASNALAVVAAEAVEKGGVVSDDGGQVITKNNVPLPQPDAEAEVEFFGEVVPGKVKAARLVFVVAKGDCKADSAELEVIEQQDVSAGKLFTEMFFPQGTVANLCLLGLDKKNQLIGFATFAKNPVTFQGEGEIEVKDLKLALQPVKTRAAPKGL